MHRVAMVIAGGGCRTLWSAGVVEGLREELSIVEWGGVSAGAAMAVMCAIERTVEGKDYFLEVTAKNPRNFYPERWLRGERLCPHEDMYADAMQSILTNDGLARLARAAPVRILHAYIERRPVLATALRALVRYQRTKLQSVHGPEEVDGLTPRIVVAQDAKTISEVIEQVLLSSATPPFTRPAIREGRTYVDGGLIDAVPVRVLSEEAQRLPRLVLLSRRYPVGVVRSTTQTIYIQPSEEIPASMWDYTNPKKIEASYQLGVRDGRALRGEIARTLTRT